MARARSDRLPTYRYRLTVEVETPEGLRSGSSVIEVRTHESVAFPGPEAATIQSRVRGEAVAVDLGRRGTLFALLTSRDRQTGASGYAWVLLPNPAAQGHDIEARRENYRALRSVERRAELPPAMYPNAGAVRRGVLQRAGRRIDTLEQEQAPAIDEPRRAQARVQGLGGRIAAVKS